MLAHELLETVAGYHELRVACVGDFQRAMRGRRYFNLSSKFVNVDKGTVSDQNDLVV
jgi:hypothetical protein